MKFEDKLRQVIKTKYNKIGDLAEKFNMNYSQLSQYLNGKKVSIEFLTKIIEEFPETDLNWLLREETGGLSVNEKETPYKRALNNQQIINEIESLLGDLKNRITNDDD